MLDERGRALRIAANRAIGTVRLHTTLCRVDHLGLFALGDGLLTLALERGHGAQQRDLGTFERVEGCEPLVVQVREVLNVVVNPNIFHATGHGREEALERRDVQAPRRDTCDEDRARLRRGAVRRIDNMTLADGDEVLHLALQSVVSNNQSVQNVASLTAVGPLWMRMICTGKHRCIDIMDVREGPQCWSPKSESKGGMNHRVKHVAIVRPLH